MKIGRRIAAFFLCGWAHLSVAAGAQPLVDAAELSVLVELPTVRVVDIRSPKEYAKDHIPQALSAPYEQWRGPAASPGQLIELELLQQLIRDLGLTADQHVVVYSNGETQTDFGAAARVYWTLKYAGLEHLSVLNGGYQHWQKDGFPVEQDAAVPTASQYVVQPNQQIVIFKEELLEKVEQPSAEVQLLDARPEAFFQGQLKAPTASVPGTIAGAVNAQHQQWFKDETATLKPITEIVQLARQQGLDQAKETVSFCNTGHWAATNWFILSELVGVENVRMYPASLAEWSQSEVALPMTHTPSRAEQIRQKFQQLFKN